MSEMGVFASRLHINSQSLRAYDEALKILKKTGDQSKEIEEQLLIVLLPLKEVLSDKLSESSVINERSVVNTLKKLSEYKVNLNWSEYKSAIVHTIKKIEQKKKLQQEDFIILNDIGDALDMECAYLFQKLRG